MMIEPLYNDHRKNSIDQVCIGHIGHSYHYLQHTISIFQHD
jgi:hypothetical protein